MKFFDKDIACKHFYRHGRAHTNLRTTSNSNPYTQVVRNQLILDRLNAGLQDVHASQANASKSLALQVAKQQNQNEAENEERANSLRSRQGAVVRAH